MKSQMEQIKEKMEAEAKFYPLFRGKLKTERGIVYCANRITSMMKNDGSSFKTACAFLESELEGMD